MEQDPITKRAIAEASPLTGWHPYPVFCGSRLIASMPTEFLRREFIAKRSLAYPKSEYGVLPLRGH
jgi:hypothetical protein